jgi:hypothetical protein
LPVGKEVYLEVNTDKPGYISVARYQDKQQSNNTGMRNKRFKSI